jgi:hypothetical protein
MTQPLSFLPQLPYAFPATVALVVERVTWREQQPSAIELTMTAADVDHWCEHFLLWDEEGVQQDVESRVVADEEQDRFGIAKELDDAGAAHGGQGGYGEGQVSAELPFRLHRQAVCECCMDLAPSSDLWRERQLEYSTSCRGTVCMNDCL